MFLLYSFFYSITIFILFLPQYLKRPNDIRGKWLREKLGFVPDLDLSIWIHAVSVGEVNASLGLLKKLRTVYPDIPIVLSTITDTGQKVALDKAPQGINVIYLPFDLASVLKRSIRLIKPKVFIVIETELWPNIFRTMADMGVPVLVLNGRISERSAQGYKKIVFFMRKVLSYVSEFGMQSQVDAVRLSQIGADENKIRVIGNFKFDMYALHTVPEWTESIEGPVIVAGSTHRGEEAIILAAYRDNLTKFPELTLIVAPRHPERFPEVEEYLRSAGMPFLKKSAMKINSQIRGIILLDTIGELSAIYRIADIAIIGKSFLGTGGQNPLEPAYWGKAIICGPHMENFPFIKEFYLEGAAFEVDPGGLSKKIRELLVSPEKTRIAGAKAREIYLINSGAVDRAVELIKGYML